MTYIATGQDQIEVEGSIYVTSRSSELKEQMFARKVFHCLYEYEFI